MGESEPSKIRLRKVNFMSSGIYRCEITSKDFEIYEKYEQMTVIGRFIVIIVVDCVSQISLPFIL